MTQTYYITVPFSEKAHGRMFYIVDAESPEAAIAKIQDGQDAPDFVCVDETEDTTQDFANAEVSSEPFC